MKTNNISQGSNMIQSNNEISIQKNKLKRGEKPFIGFIHKLFKMTSDKDIPEITWTSKGDGVKVVDSKNLIQNIFPIYFKHQCWASFTRQLNMYGFQRCIDLDQISDAREDGGLIFKHSMFLRGRRDLALRIQRKGADKHELHKQKELPGRKIITSELYSSIFNQVKQLTVEVEGLRASFYKLNQCSQKYSELIQSNKQTMEFALNILKNYMTRCESDNSELKLAVSILENDSDSNHFHRITKNPFEAQMSINLTSSNLDRGHDINTYNVNHLPSNPYNNTYNLSFNQTRVDSIPLKHSISPALNDNCNFNKVTLPSIHQVLKNMYF